VAAEPQTADFAPALLDWFDVAGRKDLPWQRDPTPYRVWVSEIMLQQTQVGTVVAYFESFMRRFPDIPTLAAAPLDEVLHLWSGLGYYARARNLQRAAQILVERHDGRLPGSIDDMIALPGIGRSTAGAILALSRGERHPILDGNVKRVLARQFGVDGQAGDPEVARRLWALADACTPSERVAEYTQAIMDLGATVCTRANPACLLCPVSPGCIARREHRQSQLPGARPKRPRPQREVWAVFARRGMHELLLERRPPQGIWGGLWGLPEFPTRAHAIQWSRERLLDPAPAETGPALRHTFSHFELTMHTLVVRCTGLPTAVRDDDRYVWYDMQNPQRLGLPKPIATLIGIASGRATAQ
jgi:A/G-specific adenine glycosylase